MHLELVFDDLGDFAQAYRGRISVEGMLLFCAAPLPSGTVIELSIALRDGLVLISGRGGVLRTSVGAFAGRELHTAALRFVHLDDDSTALIQRMEERHETEGVRPFNLDEALTHWGHDGGIEHDATGRPLPSTRLLESVDVAGADGVPFQPAPDRGPATTQRPHELYDMVTAALGDSAKAAPADESSPHVIVESPPRGSKRRVPGALLAVLAAVAVAAAVIAVVLRFFPGLIVPTVDDHVGQQQAAVAASPTIIAATAPPAPTSGDDPLAAPEPTVQPGDSTGGAADAEPTRPPAATATPVKATATPSPAAAVEAFAVRELTWQQLADHTTVTIACDHPLSMDRVTHFRLTDPPGPRYVLQISDIERSTLPYTTHVNGTEITTIRAWHHTEQTPPSLHIVMDLAASSVELNDLRTDGASLIVSFAGR